MQGGSGSVGLAVLQIAKACGARVGVTAGDDAKARRCLEMGADLVVNYRHEDVVRAERDFAPDGLDIFWQSTQGLDLERAVALMARNGRFIVVAADGKSSSFPARPFYQRNCSMHGFTVTGTGVSDLQRYARQINAWMARKVSRPQIQEIFPLSEAARAHRMHEEGGLSGKIVLVPGD